MQLLKVGDMCPFFLPWYHPSWGMTSCVQLWCSSNLWDPARYSFCCTMSPEACPGPSVLPKPGSAGIWTSGVTAANNPGSCDSYVRWENIPFFQAVKPANPCPIIPKHLSGYSSTSVEVVLILKVSGILHAKIHILASKKKKHFQGH